MEAMDWTDLLARNGVRSVLILSPFAIAQLNCLVHVTTTDTV